MHWKPIKGSDDADVATLTVSRRDIALLYQCVGSRGHALKVDSNLMVAFEDLAGAQEVRTFERTPLVQKDIL